VTGPPRPDDAPRRRAALARALAKRGIGDQRVLDAIAVVPRERFLPEEQQAQAFDDDALPLQYGQTISQPYIVALMTEALELSAGARVLEIGTGSGYQAAILAELGARVVSVERIAALADSARDRLARLGYLVEVHHADGTTGWAAGAPYDHVLVTAAAPAMPEPLWDQLVPGGKMVLPVGGPARQELVVAWQQQQQRRQRRLCHCRFVKLLGQHGWQQE